MAIRIDPQNHHAWFIRGHALLKKFEYEEAIVCFKNAKKLNPYDLKIRTFLNKTKKQYEEKKSQNEKKNANLDNETLSFLQQFIMQKAKEDKNEILINKKKEFVRIEIIIVENDDDEGEFEDEENEKMNRKEKSKNVCVKTETVKENKSNSNEEESVKKKMKKNFDFEKLEGKNSYEVKNYENALTHYNNCVSYIEQGVLDDLIDDETKSWIYSNRSQIYLLLKNFKKSKDDAEKSLSIKWNIKAAYRFAFSVYMLFKNNHYFHEHSMQQAYARLSETVEYFKTQKKMEAPKNIFERKKKKKKKKKK